MTGALSLPQRPRTGGPRLGCIGRYDFHHAEQMIEIGTPTTEHALKQIAEAIAALSLIAASVAAL